MKLLLPLILMVLLPAATGLNCYVCASGSTGCNDPFDPRGSGVSNLSSSAFTSCVKVVALGIVARSGSAGCVEVPFVANSGTKCCSTDLCNGARSNVQTPILAFISMALIFWKIYFH